MDHARRKRSREMLSDLNYSSGMHGEQLNKYCIGVSSSALEATLKV
jgi:hypothetical protein